MKQPFYVCLDIVYNVKREISLEEVKSNIELGMKNAHSKSGQLDYIFVKQVVRRDPKKWKK